MTPGGSPLSFWVASQSAYETSTALGSPLLVMIVGSCRKCAASIRLPSLSRSSRVPIRCMSIPTWYTAYMTAGQKIRHRNVIERACAQCGTSFKGEERLCRACRAKERTCLDCGSLFKGLATRCRSCRPKERACTECGRKFRGEMLLCYACRATDRTCVDCGESFMGNQNQCSPCLQLKRECIECGIQFKGTTRLCRTCRVVERECNLCGKAFKDAQQPCPVCRKSDRTCIDCDKAFRGHTRRCYTCQAVERECVECGQPFKGSDRRCRGCQAIERDCDGCGRTYRGLFRYCQACWRAALPPGEWEARARSYGNSRRARKEAAQVAGPVPPAVYAAIKASAPCVYCGAEATTVDHVRPLSRGGHEAEYNLVPACLFCNCSKNDRLLTEWRPDRVAYAVAHSPKVEAEYVRLLSLDDPGTENMEGDRDDERNGEVAAA